MGRKSTVFISALATLIFVSAAIYGMGLGAGSTLVPIAGYLGGLVPVALTALAMYMYGVVLEGPAFEEDEETENIGEQDFSK